MNINFYVESYIITLHQQPFVVDLIYKNQVTLT